MIENLIVGGRVRFDPALTVTLGASALFQAPRTVCKVEKNETLRVDDPLLELGLWSLAGEDGSHLLLVRDQQADLWFLLRLVAEARHSGGEPVFLYSDDYAVVTPNSGGSEVTYGSYSDPLLAEVRSSPWDTPVMLLFRVYVRQVEETDEFLWVVLQNDVKLLHYVGVIIHPSQVLRV
jgi:hypothetical protein